MSSAHRRRLINHACCEALALIVMLVAFQSVAQTDPGKPFPAPRHTSEFVEHPKTLSEMLANIRTLVMRKDIVRQGFYTEATLKRVFGGDAVIFHRNGNAKNISGDIAGFGTMVSPLWLSPRRVEGIQFRFDWAQDGRVIEATLRIQLPGATNVDFDDTERIFGGDWQESKPEPQLHRNYQPPTRPRGNARIEYRFDSTMIQQVLFIEFKSDATVSGIFVTAKEMK